MISELLGVTGIHLMGIGGSGMSSLARLLAGSGYTVSGCDSVRGHYIESLESMGIDCRIGHSPEHIDDIKPQLLVYSSAVSEDSPELSAARAAGIRTVKRGLALSWLFNAAEGIGVAGTHGKSTTSSMISLILERGGMSPTLYVGAEMLDLGTNAQIGNGRAFVAELDESDGSFEFFHPSVSVITTVDLDHVDHFHSMDDVVNAFVRFADGRKPGAPLVVCADDEGVAMMLERIKENAGGGAIVRCGWGSSWDWGACDVRHKPGGGVSCRVLRNGTEAGVLDLSVSGEHNVLNALAALAAAELAGVPFEKASALLGDFHGASRRMQMKGEAGGVLVIDDYAHHPTEAEATIAAVRHIYPDRRLILVFQPHRYTRTAAFIEPLSRALAKADHTVLLPVYSAGESAADTGKPVSSSDLAVRIGDERCSLCGCVEEAAEFLSSFAERGDVVLTMGAGDVYRVGDIFLARP